MQKLDGEIRALARKQGGVVGRAQLLERGITPKAIERRLATGALRGVERGAYAIGGASLPRLGVVWAAVLSCGPRSAAGCGDAAWAWEFARARTGKVYVCVAGDGGGRRRAIHLRRGKGLREEDCTEVDGLPVTTVARTLLDLAEVVGRPTLTRMVGEAVNREVYDHTAVLEVLEATARHPGASRLRAVTAEPVRRLRSELEARFLELCRLHGLPIPLMNYVLEGYEVDAYFPNERVVVEIDTLATHRTTFHSDRRRDRELQAAGYLVLRLTDEDIDAGQIDEVRRVLELRRDETARTPPENGGKIAVSGAKGRARGPSRAAGRPAGRPR